MKAQENLNRSISKGALWLSVGALLATAALFPMNRGAVAQTKSAVGSPSQVAPPVQQTGATKSDPRRWVLTTRGLGPIRLGMTPRDAVRVTDGRLRLLGSEEGVESYQLIAGELIALVQSCAGGKALGTITLQTFYSSDGRPLASPIATDTGIRVGDPWTRLAQVYPNGLRRNAPQQRGGDTVFSYTDPQDGSYRLTFNVPQSGQNMGRISEIAAMRC